MSQKLSRRTALATLAATVTTPAITFAGNHPDADLLALGEHIDIVIRDWIAQDVKDMRRLAAANAACDKAGLPELPGYNEMEERFRCLKERWALRKQLIARGELEPGDELDEHGVSIVWNDINDRLDAVYEDIHTWEPKTLAGLGVMARAVSVHYIFRNDEDKDAPVRALVEAVCAITGVRTFQSDREAAMEDREAAMEAAP